MAWFLNMIPFNNREVFVIRMADTWNTNVDRLVEYLRAAFPGTNGKTGLNDYYSREGTWPTIEQAIRENQRVFIFAQDHLCNSDCRAKYPFFINVRVYTYLPSFIILEWVTNISTELFTSHFSCKCLVDTSPFFWSQNQSGDYHLRAFSPAFIHDWC